MKRQILRKTLKISNEIWHSNFAKETSNFLKKGQILPNKTFVKKTWNFLLKKLLPTRIESEVQILYSQDKSDSKMRALSNESTRRDARCD